MASSLLLPHSSKPSPAAAATTVNPWTEEDEVRLLEAALDFAMEPAEAFDPTVSPFLRMERALAGRGFTRDDILAKIKELRRSYEETRERGNEARGCLAFEISRKIWGREERKDDRDDGGETKEKKKKKDWEEERKEEKKKKKKTKKTRTKRMRRKYRPLRDLYNNSIHGLQYVRCNKR